MLIAGAADVGVVFNVGSGRDVGGTGSIFKEEGCLADVEDAAFTGVFLLDSMKPAAMAPPATATATMERITIIKIGAFLVPEDSYPECTCKRPQRPGNLAELSVPAGMMEEGCTSW